MTRITELKEAESESRESRYYRDAGTCFVPGQRQRWWRPAQKAAVRAHRLTLQKAVWPLGTGLYSVGLLFLVASSGNNMFFVSCCCFCALPAGLERKHIFSVRFSRCWNISSFPPKNLTDLKTCLQRATPPQLSAEQNEPKIPTIRYIQESPGIWMEFLFLVALGWMNHVDVLIYTVKPTSIRESFFSSACRFARSKKTTKKNDAWQLDGWW